MKTLTALLLIAGSALLAQDKMIIKLPDQATVAAQRKQSMRAEWDAVLNGTHPKIKFTGAPNAAQLRKDMQEMCSIYMHGSEYQGAMCGLLAPTSEQAQAENFPQASPLDVYGGPYNPPGFCSQVGRLKIAFQWQADANAAQAALAGGGCAFGCTPCCIYSAALALKVVYWELYAHDMERLQYLNGC